MRLKFSEMFRKFLYTLTFLLRLSGGSEEPSKLTGKIDKFKNLMNKKALMV
jgi:hypothetical protein